MLMIPSRPKNGTVWLKIKGQYYWTQILSPPQYARAFSYITGWISVTGWVFLVATGGTLGSSMILGIISVLSPSGSFTASPTITFTLYTAIILFALCTNLRGTHLLPTLNKAAFVWSLVGIVTLSVTCIIATPSYAKPSDIFFGFTNFSGWPDSLAWALGLLQGALALTGYDSVAHMSEELPRPSHYGPRVMLIAVAMGCTTGLIFMLALLFSATDMGAVVSAAEGPLLRILTQATGSWRAAIALQIFPLGCLLSATVGIMATASRMVFAFARDNGLPFSALLARSPDAVPSAALISIAVFVEAIGVLYFVSEKVMAALISAAVVSLSISYAFPITVNMVYRRRRRLAAEYVDHVFTIPGTAGWIVNIIAVGFVAAESVLFLLPTETPVTRDNISKLSSSFFFFFFNYRGNRLFRDCLFGNYNCRFCRMEVFWGDPVSRTKRLFLIYAHKLDWIIIGDWRKL
jgi:choline transport protein